MAAYDQGHYPWLQEAYEPSTFILGDYSALCHDFMSADYRAASGSVPVVATVHVEAERDRSEALAETRWLQAQRLETGIPTAIVAWTDFAHPDVDAHLAAQASCPSVRGIRCKPRTAPRPERSVAGEPGSMQDPRWLTGLLALERHGLSWDLRVPFWHLEEAAVVAFDGPAHADRRRARRPAVGSHRSRTRALAAGNGSAGGVR